MATTICQHLINSDIDGICSSPIFAGADNIALIANKSDIASVTYDANNANIVTGMTMKSGAVFYKVHVEGRTPFTGSNVEMTEGTYANKFTKHFNFVILNDGSAVIDDIINPLANGEFVAIIQNSWHNASADNKYEVIGLDRGLRANAITNDRYSEDTDGGWQVEMQEENSPKAKVFFFTSSESATDSAIQALLTASN